jgi:hypothetical protein
MRQIVANKAGMVLSPAEGRAGTLLNESFAVAEKPEQESARFSFSGNLFDCPFRSSLHSQPLYYSLEYSTHFLNTLCVRARSIDTVITLCGFSSLTIVVTDADGETVIDGGEATKGRLESFRGRGHAVAVSCQPKI